VLSALLSLPLTAPASQAAGGLLTAIICPGNNAVVFHASSSKAPRQDAKAKLAESIWGAPWVGTSETKVSLGWNETWCKDNFADLTGYAQTGVVSNGLLAELEKDGIDWNGSGYTLSQLGIVVGSTRYSIINTIEGAFAFGPSLHYVDFLGGQEDYASDGSFISKIVATSLPTISTNASEVTCTAGTYRAEYLNDSQDITSANYRISLQSDGGELASMNTTANKASFAIKDLPKSTMIWCVVEAAANSRVSIARSIDDKASFNSIATTRKSNIRQAKLDWYAKKITDLDSALAKAEEDFRLALAAKGLAIFIS
jgi:hypothetical protein